MKKLSFLLIVILIMIFAACIPDDNGEDTGDTGDGGSLERRYPAQWEPMDGIIIIWDLITVGDYESDVLGKTIIKEASQVGNVYIVINNSSLQSSVTTELTTFGGVKMESLKFVVYSGCSVWVRDFGPGFITENGELKVLDFNFAYNQSDQSFPTTFAAFKYITIIDANDVFIPGGNYISDGVDTSFMTNIINLNNPSNVLELLSAHTGNNNNILTQYTANENTKHIDVYVKMINSTTFIVGQYASPSVGDDYTVLENIATQLQGAGYTVVRIPQLEPYILPAKKDKSHLYRNGDKLNKDKQYQVIVNESYTNSLIINGKVLVPAYNKPTDATAQNIYETNMPNYNIIMIDSTGIIKWEGAIHCVIHEVPLVE